MWLIMFCLGFEIPLYLSPFFASPHTIIFIHQTNNLLYHKFILFRSARSRNNSGNEGTAEEYYIDMIVSRHARKLLGAYRLRDLALFAAHLDYKLVNWIGKER